MSTVTADVFGPTGPARAPQRAATLAQVEEFIRTYVILTADQSALITLWVILTHAIDAFDYVPYLHIKSPMPECGKTRLLEVLEALVPNPWLTGRVTTAVLMRKIDAEHPVLLLDESDAAFAGDQEYGEALRGMLNSGFHRSGRASACVGQGSNLTYKDFSTFAPKAVAGIGRLPSTVESRSIPIALKRRTKAETVAKWRRRDAWELAGSLRARLADIWRPCVEVLGQARPVLPEGLSDRAEDVLEPIFAIAEFAGDTWAQRAREAAVTLMGHAARSTQEADQQIRLELLADIFDLFDRQGFPRRLRTEALIGGLTAMDDRPWSTFTRGEKPITPHRLARLLKDLDIQKPLKMRDADETFRGYELAAFKDAFARYLPSKVEQAEPTNKTGPAMREAEAEHRTTVPHSRKAVSPGIQHSVPLVPLSRPDTKERGHDAEDVRDADGYYVGR